MDENKRRLSLMYSLTYNKLEEEILALTYHISFTDEQLSVYSTYIADLILRISAEIETVAKDVYRRSGGRKSNPKVDYDCIDILQNREKACALIYNDKMAYTMPKNQLLFPLRKSHKKTDANGCQVDTYPWNIAYQSLKHNKNQNVKKYGTIYYLLSGLAALFLLLTKYGNYVQSSAIFVNVNANGSYPRPVQRSQIFASITGSKQLNYFNYMQRPTNQTNPPNSAVTQQTLSSI